MFIGSFPSLYSLKNGKFRGIPCKPNTLNSNNLRLEKLLDSCFIKPTTYQQLPSELPATSQQQLYAVFNEMVRKNAKITI